MAVFVSKRLGAAPPAAAANVAQPVHGPTVTAPVANRTATLQGFRGRPVAQLFCTSPDYVFGAVPYTKARVANANVIPPHSNNVSDATFDFSDPLRLRFRTTPWAKYVWACVQLEAESYTENSGTKPIVHMYLQTPVVNGAGGLVFDNGCEVEPVASPTAWGRLHYVSTTEAANDTTVKSTVPRLLNLDAGGIGNGVDTDVELVVDIGTNTTGVRVFSVSAWELWEATVE
jgi:hypothetical protein